MRIFDDEEGRRWQAATAFGSYGEARLIFSRMDGDELRSAAVNTATLREAEQALDAFGEAALLDYLHKAEPWSDAS